MSNQYFEVSSSFVNFNRVYKKIMITIGLGVYITLKPSERKVIQGDKEVIEKYIECNYVDETSGYTYGFELSLGNVNELITVLQTLKGQMQATNTTGDSGSTGCTRQVVIK